MRRDIGLPQRQPELRTLRQQLLYQRIMHGRFLQLFAGLRAVHGQVCQQGIVHERFFELRTLWQFLRCRPELHWRQLPQAVKRNALPLPPRLQIKGDVFSFADVFQHLAKPCRGLAEDLPLRLFA